MLLKFKSFIIPGSNDPDEIRRRNLLNILSRGIFILALLSLIIAIAFIVISPIYLEKPGTVFLLLSIVIFTLGSLAVFFINKRSSRIAAFLLLTLFIIGSIFSDTPEQLSAGRSSFPWSRWRY